MKSKSFELSNNSPEEVNLNKTADFIKYYKPAAETNIAVNNVSKLKSHTPKRQNSPIKNKKKHKKEMDISQINIDGASLRFNAGNSSDAVHVTSTPNATNKKIKNTKVKSIMKNSSIEEVPDTSTIDVSNVKPKKRNKSVSFMLEENEGVAIKKSKSEESVADKKSQSIKINDNISKKKNKHNHKSPDGKENKSDVSNIKMDIDQSEKPKKKQIKNKCKVENSQAAVPVDVPSPDNQSNHKPGKKIRNKKKVVLDQVPVEMSSKSAEDSFNTESENKNEENKTKKIKKKKRQSKETDGEPATKSRKRDLKPEVIAESLENLNIGDNPHSLTSLIDEMTVADKKKKNKKSIEIKDIKKKLKARKEIGNPKQETSTDDKVEQKEKVKWLKRKFNKDKKGTISEDKHLTSIIIENLPFPIICTYKKLLQEHFTKFGMVRQVGAAEVYPNEDPKPVFTTTIIFYSEDAAEKSLEEDNTLFNGNRIRVKQPLPPTQTTLVVHSFAELSLQALSSLFSSAGRIRNIRNILKGKNSKSTAFVEFDGPEALNQAVKMAEKAKIGGKNIHVSKFEFRKTSANKGTETNKTNGTRTVNSDN